MNEIHVISSQDCYGRLERKAARLGSWVNADGYSFNPEIFDDEKPSSTLIISAIKQADAAIMRMTR